MFAEIIAKVATPNVKFAVFNYTAKGTGETAQFSVMLGASLESLYRQDVAVLNAMLPNLDGIRKVAALEILASRNESLTKGIGNNSAYVHGKHAADTYVNIPGLPGVKVHKATGEMYVTGIISHKVVITPGTYKTVNSSEKTLAKKEIEKSLGSSKYRQFSLPAFNSVTVDGETLNLN